MRDKCKKGKSRPNTGRVVLVGALVVLAILFAAQEGVAERRTHNDQRSVLMSLKPRHADRLLSGAKGYEMRRIGPRWGQGTKVLIYASGPNHADDRGKTAKALVGCFTAGQVQRGSVLGLWLSLGRAGAATFDGLLERYKGGEGHAIEITGPRKLRQSVTLESLRQQVSGFRPPQMYQYITPNQRPLLNALERGLRNGTAPCGPAGCSSAESRQRPERWLAHRQGGRQQHFVYHNEYNWRRAANPLLAASYSRPANVLAALEQAGLAPRERVHQPRPLSAADLGRVHTQKYVARVLQGSLPPREGVADRNKATKLARYKDALQGAWSVSRASHAKIAAGGTYTAAKLALREKTIVGNLAPGTGQVGKQSAAGLETFNGPVVAARKLIAEGAVQRVMIVDGDLAYGGGTNKLTARDNRIAYVSIYGVPAGEPFHGGTNAALPVPRRATTAEYLSAYSKGLARQIDRFRPELIIFNASASPHHGDPTNQTVGLQVSSRGLALRDAMVFSLARSRGVPVCWELGAGHHPDGAKLAAIHTATAQAADQVLARVRPGDRVRFQGNGSSWRTSGGVVTFPRFAVSSSRAGQLFGPAPSSTPPAE